MSATEFLFGKGKREFSVAGIISINHTRGTPNKREINEVLVKKLVEDACRAQPWIDDEYPSPRVYVVSAEESGNEIKVTIALHDLLRQSQLRPFSKYIVSIVHHLCYGELEYLGMHCELVATKFLGFGVWG